MDLTDCESQDWTKRGHVEAASTDGDGVTITGDPGDLPDDVDGSSPTCWPTTTSAATPVAQSSAGSPRAT